ncbi:MAG TPA: hypothetical protein EYN06_03435 [Myxococcales bacterium]|nr:hypothetical protein [Myxococcales bacterium]HIN85510.1 hypothetical protein [Myxococcales bacterium]
MSERKASIRTPHSHIAVAFGAPAFVLGTIASFFVNWVQEQMLGVIATVATLLVALPFWRVVMKSKAGPKRGGFAGAIIGTVSHPVMWFLILAYESVCGRYQFENWSEPLAYSFYASAFSLVYTAGSSILVGAVIGHFLNTRAQKA